MNTLEGKYLDGRQPFAATARMDFNGPEATLVVGQTILKYATNRLIVSPRIVRLNRFITLPDGGQFMCTDHHVLDSLAQESRSEGPVAWLEDRWGVALAAVALIAILVGVAYFYVLPIAAETVAARIPVETERGLGQQALNWLDNKQWFKPTKLDQNKQNDIQDGFKKLCSDLPNKNYYKIEFRDAPIIGPNAFALPGGTIVITDEMVKLTESPEEVLAILAHEIGHVELHHTLRSILQNSAIAVLAATVTADAASLSVAVTGLPVLAAQTKYSREFEAAADDYAFRLLKQKGYSPLAFASLMERLSQKHNKIETAFSFISTHPITSERVERARAAAQVKDTSPNRK
jgi:predicted Zn-dependent protease